MAVAKLRTLVWVLVCTLFATAVFVFIYLGAGFTTTSKSAVSGGYVLQRPPVSLPDALSLIQQGQVQLIEIDSIQDDAQFQLGPSPFDLSATPIQQWNAKGYAVWLFGADEPDGLAVLSPGEETIGLDNPEIRRLLQEADNLNRVIQCRVVVVDLRSLEISSPVAPSPPGCPLPTGTATMPLSPEEGLAEGIARPPLTVAEARQMILDGRVEVLRLRSEKYPDGVQRAYRYLDDGNQQLLRVRGIDVLLYNLSRPDSRPVTNSSTAVGVNEAELQSLLDAVNEASQNGKVIQVIDERN